MLDTEVSVSWYFPACKFPDQGSVSASMGYSKLLKTLSSKKRKKKKQRKRPGRGISIRLSYNVRSGIVKNRLTHIKSLRRSDYTERHCFLAKSLVHHLSSEMRCEAI